MNRRVFLWTTFGVFVVLWPTRVNAYAWMIRYGYTQCVTCHADPDGGGLLNPYGRAQGEILLRMRYTAPPDREPGTLAEPLFGLLHPSDSLLVGGDIRFANVRVMPNGGEAQSRFILMQADALGQYALGRVRANGSVGYVSEGANGAAITRGTSTDAKLISRLHWVGIDIGRNREWLLRAGRIAIPFGIRSIEHTLFVRSETRTDINDSQSYGVAADYHQNRVRAGAMLIVGDLVVSPDHFRSRGYAGYAEYALDPTATVGASSMITWTKLDISYLTPAFRHAHGVFARYAPIRQAVLSSEWDFLFTSQPTPDTNHLGAVGALAVDLEPVQGFHFGPTYELDVRDFGGPTSYGYWVSAWWFFLPHADLRLDVIGQSLGSPVGPNYATSAVAQVHIYL
jgi:hypothetical protein